MTKSPIFWIAVGAGLYWGVQHFTGVGNTGKGRPASAG
jgi:hypothetical protein